MADTKVSALTEVSVPDVSDDVYLVDDTGPTSYKCGVDRLLGLFASTCEGRLTLVSNDPVPAADTSTATNVYFTPLDGNRVTLYDGTRWRLYTFSQLTLAIGTVTAALPYDVFLYDNAGTLTLEQLAWTSGTARATALVRQDGVWCKTGALTRRYLGTFYTISTTETADTQAKRFLWNMYNRVLRAMQVEDATTSWTYTIATIRQSNANAANQIAFVRGLDEDAVEAHVRSRASNTTAGVIVSAGIGLDSTSLMVGFKDRRAISEVTGNTGVFGGSWVGLPGIGYHFLSWNEISGASGTTTWYGTSGSVPATTGIYATVMA